MVIGSLVLTLHLPQSQSLKSKRQVISSLTQRVRRTFNVAVAEVESLDSWQLAVIGVACVSNDRRHADEMLNKVANWVAEDGGRGEALLTRQDIELIQA
ncbi:MAG TPA: DUF503 domain-containing protein [Candidatus Dormibacteraeota bacterium]|nr:DUF503 domain-containing protein [Candidatus Dormibacteraeota bacterium]